MIYIFHSSFHTTNVVPLLFNRLRTGINGHTAAAVRTLFYMIFVAVRAGFYMARDTLTILSIIKSSCANTTINYFIYVYRCFIMTRTVHIIVIRMVCIIALSLAYSHPIIKVGRIIGDYKSAIRINSRIPAIPVLHLNIKFPR